MTLQSLRGTPRNAKPLRAPNRRSIHPFAVLTLAAGLAAIPEALYGAPAPSFEDIAARLDGHPSVMALRARAESSTGLARAARALPDPTVSFSVNNIPVSDPAFDRFLPSNKSVGIQQQIPNAGVRRARSARERDQGRQYDLQADYQIALLRAELTGALADKARIGRQLKHAQSQLKRYDEMERILRGEVEAGRPVYFRLSEIDVERANVDRRLADLRNELAQTDAALVELVGDSPDTPPPSVVLERWNNVPQALFPVVIAETGIRMAEAGVREGKAAYGPNIGLRLQYQQREDGVSDNGMPFAGDDWFSAGISLSVPIWAAQSQAPRLRAARARESAARASFHAVLRTTRERLSALYSAHDTAMRNIEILRAKENSLRELIAAANRNYEAGRGSLIQILDGEVGLLTLQSQIEDERARQIKAAAQANSHLVTQ